MKDIITRNIREYNIIRIAETGEVLITKCYPELGITEPVYDINFNEVELRSGLEYDYLSTIDNLPSEGIVRIGSFDYMAWFNNKNNTIYHAIGISVNATNDLDGQIGVVYKKGGSLYFRELTEFLIKFRPGFNNKYKYKTK